MLSVKRLLYNRVSTAREHCAGCTPADKSQLLREIDEALAFAYEVEAHPEIINKLTEARRIVNGTKTYYERIPADQILCEILNVDLKG